MDTIKKLKEFFPEIPHNQRKVFASVFEIKSKRTNKKIEDIIKEERLLYLKKKEEDTLLLLNKMLATGLLVETNDLLKDTTLDDYYCRITAKNGRSFMNAQYKLYNNEYNSLMTSQGHNGNHILSQLERGQKILSKSMIKDFDNVFDICELMEKDEVFSKRIQGIYKQHLKQIS